MSTDTPDTADQSETPDSSIPSKERLGRVASLVEHNTGGGQPPLVKRSFILYKLCYADGLSRDDAELAIKSACDHGHIFETDDPIELPTDGGDKHYLGIDDIGALNDKITQTREHHDDPSEKLKTIIGAANRRVIELRNAAKSEPESEESEPEEKVPETLAERINGENE